MPPYSSVCVNVRESFSHLGRQRDARLRSEATFTTSLVPAARPLDVVLLRLCPSSSFTVPTSHCLAKRIATCFPSPNVLADGKRPPAVC